MISSCYVLSIHQLNRNHLKQRAHNELIELLNYTQPSPLRYIPSVITQYITYYSRKRERGKRTTSAGDEDKKIAIGAEPDTLTIMGNLASMYRNQGREKEGVVLRVQVIEVRKQVMGIEYPNTLTSMWFDISLALFQAIKTI